MQSRKRALTRLFALQGLILALAACEGRAGLDQKILGKWMDVRSQPGNTVYYEFFKDGTVVMELVGPEKQYVVGTYSFLDSTRIKMRFTAPGPTESRSGPTKVMSVSVSGTEATLLDLHGVTIKLTRTQKKGDKSGD